MIFFHFQTNETVLKTQKMLGDRAINLPFSLKSFNKITSNRKNCSNRVVNLELSKEN